MIENGERDPFGLIQERDVFARASHSRRRVDDDRRRDGTVLRPPFVGKIGGFSRSEDGTRKKNPQRDEERDAERKKREPFDFDASTIRRERRLRKAQPRENDLARFSLGEQVDRDRNRRRRESC